jgi:NTE family protein
MRISSAKMLALYLTPIRQLRRIVLEGTTNMAKYKVGLALGGGGARGLAHIGVLKVLEENHIQIDCLAGTSMGGVIAAAYALGMSAEDIENEAIKFSKVGHLVSLLDPNPARRGFLEGNRVKKYLQSLFEPVQFFENLKIPLILNAVDLNTCQEIAMTEGPLLPALLGTIAVPGLFPPAAHNGQLLIDGGVLNNVPTSHMKSIGADLIIAVDVLTDPVPEAPRMNGSTKTHFQVPLPDFFVDLYRALIIMSSQNTRLQLLANPPDILIHPDIPADITMFLGFLQIHEVIAAGERSALQALPQIESLLETGRITQQAD